MAIYGWSGLTASVHMLHLLLLSLSFQLQAELVINRCKKFGFCGKELPSVTELFGEADDKLFSSTMNNIHHVLQT